MKNRPTEPFLGRRDRRVRVDLEPWCAQCHLGSPTIAREVVCTSHRDLWESWRCMQCSMRGLVCVPIHDEHRVEMCEWDEGRVEDLADLEWADEDRPPG